MKKAVTLSTIAVLIAASSFAQYGRDRDDNYENNRDREVTVNNHGGRDYGRMRGTYYFTAREKDMQIYSINREYNRRIESVKHRFFMGRERKEQLICSLELQRNAEIRSVIGRFNDRRNLFVYRDNVHRDRDRNKW